MYRTWPVALCPSIRCWRPYKPEERCVKHQWIHFSDPAVTKRVCVGRIRVLGRAERRQEARRSLHVCIPCRHKRRALVHVHVLAVRRDSLAAGVCVRLVDSAQVPAEAPPAQQHQAGEHAEARAGVPPVSPAAGGRSRHGLELSVPIRVSDRRTICSCAAWRLIGVEWSGTIRCQWVGKEAREYRRGVSRFVTRWESSRSARKDVQAREEAALRRFG